MAGPLDPARGFQFVNSGRMLPQQVADVRLAERRQVPQKRAQCQAGNRLFQNPNTEDLGNCFPGSVRTYYNAEITHDPSS